MDSLTRDVEKIFNASREMGYQEIYDEKTMAFKVLKRLFDITASSFALLILSPVFLLTAIAILLEDGGPVFFIQPRAGKGMNPFGCTSSGACLKMRINCLHSSRKKMNSPAMPLKLKMIHVLQRWGR